HNFVWVVHMKSRRIVIGHPHRNEPVLWLIDSEQWPRACLRAELIERGYDARGFITIYDALDSLSRNELSKPVMILLELRGQTLNRQFLDEISNLRIPTVVAGGSVEVNDPLIQQRQWEAVLQRPVSLGNIADAIEKIVDETAQQRTGNHGDH